MERPAPIRSPSVTLRDWSHYIAEPHAKETGHESLELRRRVEEMPGAAGTLFSLLPPENASGNYVKVVQRLPVRIRLGRGEDADHRLRPGMSVETRVRVN